MIHRDARTRNSVEWNLLYNEARSIIYQDKFAPSPFILNVGLHHPSCVLAQSCMTYSLVNGHVNRLIISRLEPYFAGGGVCHYRWIIGRYWSMKFTWDRGPVNIGFLHEFQNFNAHGHVDFCRGRKVCKI